MKGNGSTLQDSIADRLEVADLVTSLFVATDEKNWSVVRACFTDEVLFDMSSLTGSPAATVPADLIVEGWRAALEPIQSLHHQIGNVLVRTAGAAADVFCYGTATHYRPNLSGKNTRTFVGTYDFHAVRTSERWRIDRFRFTAKFVEGNLELEKM